MRIVTARRISQLFFLLLFLWFCLVTSAGTHWWQIRGWPVNWFLQLDPLLAAATMLTTGTLYGGLLWALVTVVLTMVLGRFFCGWLCPLGTLQQVVGVVAGWKLGVPKRIARNRFHPMQTLKYLVLVFFLGAALFRPSAVSLQTGLLDPICLLQRSVNLVLLPLFGLDSPFAAGRITAGAWFIAGMFFAVILLCMKFPRVYCRFVCPLGALFGLLSRMALWRVGKIGDLCSRCSRCESACEGACSPAGSIRSHECVLCMNCIDRCREDALGYRHELEVGGTDRPDLSRRAVLITLASGVVAVPVVRLSGTLAGNASADLIRPPGALAEIDFLRRCTKCGQCMRVCPSRVIQPALLQAGIEGLWTPVLDATAGTSGCQVNCVACGHVCPTAAIRPISLDERQGKNAFAGNGPIRLGTAFVDRGRCLPWAMHRPCLVCEENCPVSPKAIFTEASFQPVRGNPFRAAFPAPNRIQLVGNVSLGSLATGDYYCRIPGLAGLPPVKIAGQQETLLQLATPLSEAPASGQGDVEIMIRLKRPYVDPKYCIGCGICEHECPVSTKRAIRVTAENESRHRRHRLLT
jgi:polyferredoxin